MSLLAALGSGRQSHPMVQSLWRFGAIAVQLCAILVVLRQFQIESRAFREVAIFAFVGFAIHYFLPHRFRLSFFALLSISSVFLIFGWTNGAWMLGFGAALLGIC